MYCTFASYFSSGDYGLNYEAVWAICLSYTDNKAHCCDILLKFEPKMSKNVCHSLPKYLELWGCNFGNYREMHSKSMLRQEQ